MPHIRDPRPDRPGTWGHCREAGGGGQRARGGAGGEGCRVMSAEISYDVYVRTAWIAWAVQVGVAVVTCGRETPWRSRDGWRVAARRCTSRGASCTASSKRERTALLGSGCRSLERPRDQILLEGSRIVRALEVRGTRRHGGKRLGCSLLGEAARSEHRRPPLPRVRATTLTSRTLRSSCSGASADAFVAAFSARSVTREGMVEAAREDYRKLVQVHMARHAKKGRGTSQRLILELRFCTDVWGKVYDLHLSHSRKDA